QPHHPLRLVPPQPFVNAGGRDTYGAGDRARRRCQRAGTFGQKDQVLATLARENLIFTPKSS
ncbi:MAG: hypothetical protein WA231_02810, partial [Methylocella sp.]